MSRVSPLAAAVTSPPRNGAAKRRCGQGSAMCSSTELCNGPDSDFGKVMTSRLPGSGQSRTVFGAGDMTSTYASLPLRPPATDEEGHGVELSAEVADRLESYATDDGGRSITGQVFDFLEEVPGSRHGLTSALRSLAVLFLPGCPGGIDLGSENLNMSREFSQVTAP